MRSHYAVFTAAVAVIVIGFGVRLIFFSGSAAISSSAARALTSGDVYQAQPDDQRTSTLSEQKMHDMTFVFPEGD